MDDDESVRESLPDLLREFGYEARAFSSAGDIPRLRSRRRDELPDPGHRMPGMTGPELQRGIERRRQRMSRSCSSPPKREQSRLANGSREQGAVACLFKPFSDTALSGGVQARTVRCGPDLARAMNSAATQVRETGYRRCDVTPIVFIVDDECRYANRSRC